MYSVGSNQAASADLAVSAGAGDGAVNTQEEEEKLAAEQEEDGHRDEPDTRSAGMKEQIWASDIINLQQGSMNQI